MDLNLGNLDNLAAVPRLVARFLVLAAVPGAGVSVTAGGTLLANDRRPTTVKTEQEFGAKVSRGFRVAAVRARLLAPGVAASGYWFTGILMIFFWMA